MKLKTHTFAISDANGNDINIEDLDVMVMLNGKQTDIKLKDLFSPIGLEFSDGEVEGNTLLSFYNITEDGMLEVEGSKVGLFLPEINAPVKITSMERPMLNDDEMIAFERVVQFAEMLSIAQPEEVFTDLNEEEKQAFINARAKSEEAKRTADTAATATAAAYVEQKAKEQEEKRKEKELRESIDPNHVFDKKDYNSVRSFYNSIKFSEYIQNPYHLFYGKSEEHEPEVLIKRGADWWEQCTDVMVADEDEENVVIIFTDGNIEKEMKLNIATGEINLTDKA